MFNRVFEDLGIDAVYISVDVTTEVLNKFLAKGANKFRALNVTSPHKSRVFSACGSYDAAAGATGSVNLIIPGEKGMAGFNTDVVGFTDLLNKSGFETYGKTVTILGTGGAARSVVYSLRNVFNPEKILMVSRDPYSWDQRVPNGVSSVIPYSDIPSDTALLVNCTPIAADLKIGDDILDAMQYHNALDLVYGRHESNFTIMLKERGWNVRDGSDMYIAQAVETLKLVYGEDFTNLRDIFEKHYVEFMEGA